MYEAITFEKDDRVAIITLCRPERLNAISLKLEDEFQAALKVAEHDPDIRVIVVRGAGERAFSSGYDLLEEAEQEEFSPAAWAERLARDFEFTMSVWRCQKPTLAAIRGYCVAGGMEFAGMCDIRYCSDDAQFGVVETRFSSGVVTQILPWIVGAQCRELIYTGDMFDAVRAREIGFVTRVFPAQQLDEQVLKIAKRMSMVAAQCLIRNKQAVNGTFEAMGIQSALNAGLNIATILDSGRTPEYAHFDKTRRAHGLQAALKWSASQFKPYE